jgi:hypothetical protein
MNPGNDLFYDPLGPSPAANSAGFTAGNSTSGRSRPMQGHRPDANTGGTRPAARQTHDMRGAAGREAALQSVRRDLERLSRLRTAP